jgi:alpha-N-arabinofuranosidase
MTNDTTVHVNTKRVIGRRDAKILGQFLEHFHRQIYGGVWEPGSPLADRAGFRTDVVAALRRLAPPLVRWPGGCFVSAYHWKDGVGASRQPSFDKAWRVEESNAFGTDEFVAWCRLVGTEPYLCTNAGSGSPEEMSDWVEYCNLKDQGRWARARIENGHPEPHAVKYWSIGNENYLPGEIGAKSAGEWGRFVKESAKMMKRVDPTIELLAASVNDPDWNANLLREAGDHLDWISVHGYWDPLWQNNALSSYETCMGRIPEIESAITKTEHLLGAFGRLGTIRIAVDEWNLRGWHHPNVDRGTDASEYVAPRDKNDLNASYTLADAVFSASFLNRCLAHCRTVGMANFAPTVNTRGAVYTYPGGVVLRPTYFVFELYRLLGDVVVDSWVPEAPTFGEIEALDVVATTGAGGGLQAAVVNRHPDRPLGVVLDAGSAARAPSARLLTLTGPTKDSYNDVGHPDTVGIVETALKAEGGRLRFEVGPHSVNVVLWG